MVAPQTGGYPLLGIVAKKSHIFTMNEVIIRAMIVATLAIISTNTHMDTWASLSTGILIFAIGVFTLVDVLRKLRKESDQND